MCVILIRFRKLSAKYTDPPLRAMCFVKGSTFAVNQLSVGHEVEYGKKKGDFKVNGKYTFEVGGPSKDFKQIVGVPDSYVLADDIDYPYGNKLPLWIVGFLY